MDVTPDTATGNQSSWTGSGSTAYTLRLEWDSAGLPGFLAATDCSIQAFVPGGGSLGGIWNPTITGDSGSATQTLHFDSDPVNGTLNSSALRHGLIELHLTVNRSGAGSWSADSRGGGSPPVGATHNWARGLWFGEAILTSFGISNVSFGGSEPSEFGFPDATLNRVTMQDHYYFYDLKLTHTVTHGEIRSETIGSSASGVRDYLWDVANDRDNLKGRINAAYRGPACPDSSAANANVDVKIIFPNQQLLSHQKARWAATGQPAGWTVSGDQTTITDAARFTVNCSLDLYNAVADETLYNRGETITGIGFCIRNARGDAINISTPWGFVEASGTQTHTPSGGCLSGKTFAIANNDQACYYDPTPWHLRTRFAELIGSDSIDRNGQVWSGSTTCAATSLFSVTSKYEVADLQVDEECITQGEQCIRGVLKYARGEPVASKTIFGAIENVGSSPCSYNVTSIETVTDANGNFELCFQVDLSTTGDKRLEISNVDATLGCGEGFTTPCPSTFQGSAAKTGVLFEVQKCCTNPLESPYFFVSCKCYLEQNPQCLCQQVPRGWRYSPPIQRLTFPPAGCHEDAAYDTITSLSIDACPSDGCDFFEIPDDGFGNSELVCSCQWSSAATADTQCKQCIDLPDCNEFVYDFVQSRLTMTYHIRFVNGSLVTNIRSFDLAVHLLSRPPFAPPGYCESNVLRSWSGPIVNCTGSNVLTRTGGASNVPKSVVITPA